MTRLIDADKVNATIDKFIGYLDEDMILRIKMKISAIPTVEQPKQKWIPFSERLPEEGKLVLVTLNPISLKDAEHPVIITKYTTEKDSWIHTIPDAVLAWMPLPEPYKGGEK